MKRIVREVNPNIHYIAGKDIITVDATVWTKEAAAKVFNLIDQITFEQAFAEWKKKPIAFISKRGVVRWVISQNDWFTNDGKPINDKSEFHDIWFTADAYSPFKNWRWVKKEKLMALEQVYQSESWEIFSEIDKPTLIRMAREGV